jgi:CheY-like chemotaxis protein
VRKGRELRAKSPVGGAQLRVLVACRPDAQRTELVDALEGEGFHVTQVADGFALLERMTIAAPWFPLETDAYDLVVADEWLPGASGVEVLDEMRGAGSSAPVVVMTKHPASAGLIQQVKGLGAQVFDSAVEMVEFAVEVEARHAKSHGSPQGVR